MSFSPVSADKIGGRKITVLIGNKTLVQGDPDYSHLMQAWFEMRVYPPVDFMRREIMRTGESGHKNIKSRRMC